jgi:mannose-1-phosphate guanylyltransferase
MKIVILAGGTGTRFWPMSRNAKPKQFSTILDRRTMLECTFDRFIRDYDVSQIFVLTVPQFKDIVQKFLPKLPKENIIVEPEKRDTAPAMGYASCFLSLLDPHDPMVFVPSDHYIANVEKFIKSLKIAEKIVKEQGKLLDIAIPPNFPSRVLGYTHIGQKYQDINGISIFEFLGHVEKPNYNLAKKYVMEGNYLWHANFYMWTPELFLKAYRQYAPRLFGHLSKIKELLGKNDSKMINEEYSKMEKISFDYAVTEKMKPEEVLIIRGDFGWSDVGAWDVLHDQLSRNFDEYGNLVKGKWYGIDTSGSLIYGEKGKIIATIGVDDLIIVDTKDALLVCPHSRAQDVKKIVEKLKEKNEKKYL